MPGILETIETPEDLKRLSMAELDELAKELRAFILENVSRTGGHLASSLGAVELTLALHYVFNTPLDKIVWDVGHQAYAHKIVTGRRERFSTLRQYGGLSPFINPNESLYDTFVSGHVGNAISAASGLCEAMRFAGNPNKVIAVIGDGSLSNGLTFEGLNFVGKREQNLIVVLNDNKMSISSTVGALADYLSRIMTSKTVRDLKEEVKTGIRRLPVIGDRIFSMVKYIENNLKGMIAPGVLFEEMGLRYLGPIDGHNISHLVETFKNVSMMKGPIIIHVHTEKGHGYKPAQRNPEHYHGVGKFNLINGESEAKVNGRTYSQVFGDTLVELASKDPRVIAVSAAMTSGTGLKRFAHTFPDRFYDVGIAEGHAVTMSAAMALSGLRPYVAIYSTFLQRGYDEIIHDVALQKAPVVFAIDRAGLVGEDGPTHHGIFDIPYLRCIPNITLMIPRDQIMLSHMLKQTLMIQGPVAIRYPRGRVQPNPLGYRGLELGKAEVLRDGDRISVFCCGPLCYSALEAVRGIDGVAVVDMVFAKPIDASTIRSFVAKTKGRFVVVEGSSVKGGLGSAVLEVLDDMNMPFRFKLLGIPDRFVSHGSVGRLTRLLELDAEGIRNAIKAIL